MKYINKLLSFVSFALILAACSSPTNIVPASDNSNIISADPTNEDDMRLQLVSGVGYDELANCISLSKSKDSTTTNYSVDNRIDKITSNLVGDETSVREVRTMQDKTKRYDNDIIVKEYSGNEELRSDADSKIIDYNYIYCDLINFYSTKVFSKNADRIIEKTILGTYDIKKYEEIMYLGFASSIVDLDDSNYLDYKLAGHLRDGSVYARKENVISETRVINGTSYPCQYYEIVELFYKDNFLYQYRTSDKLLVNTNGDEEFNLLYQYGIETYSFSQGSNGNYDVSSIPSDTSII